MDLFKKPSFRCRRKTRVPGEKPVEASLDWKPNGHTAPGLGIKPGLSGPQRGGSTAALPTTCFPKYTPPFKSIRAVRSERPKLEIAPF